MNVKTKIKKIWSAKKLKFFYVLQVVYITKRNTEVEISKVFLSDLQIELMSDIISMFEQDEKLTELEF